MLKQKNRSLLLLLPLLIYSCSFIEFKDLEISFNISENQRYFSKNYISIDFSYTPKTTDNEKCIVLKENEKAVNIDITWKENYCLINPSEGWKKGLPYELTVQGTVYTKDNGNYKVDYARYFTYGDKEKLFKLTSVSIKDGTTISEKTPIEFTFNKEINQVSFNENFKLSPHVEYETIFNNNKVTIAPLENWQINTFFEWNFENLKSNENYYINKKNSGFFKTPDDTEIPYVVSTDIVSIFENTYTWLNRDLSLIVNGQAIGFIFSKSMDYDSIRNSLTFSPALKGDLIKLPDSDDKKFIYIPSADFKLDTQYKMLLSTNAKDNNGHTLKEEFIKLFKSANNYITINKIYQEHSQQGTDDTIIYDGQDASIINTIELPTGQNKISITIELSTPIEAEFKYIAENSINISLVFPNTESNPSISSISWNSTNDKMRIDLKDLSKGNQDRPVYYKINITGGENGIKNKSGEYMKESLCVNFMTN